MPLLPRSISDAIEALSDLPGIGTRSAERLVFALLKNENGLEQKIGITLQELKKNLHECEQCCHLAEEPLCPICQDSGRSDKQLCVIASPLDLLALERTHEYRGKYHVLHGVISPLDRVRPEDLRMDSLFDRLKKDVPEEIILALSGTAEADATALYLHDELGKIFPGKISRLARGIPSGGDLDYLDAGTLSRAMLERRAFD